MKKIAVVLFNLGGPDSKEAIKPFLFNFFIDKNIIHLPYFLRWVIAKWISIKRSRGKAGSSYACLNYRSPLLDNTKAQSQALEIFLNTQEETGVKFKTFVSMRYWHPFAFEIAQDVQAYNPDKIILLPLYPQYSTTTTKSSFESWQNAIKNLNYKCPTFEILCYPDQEGFIKACAGNIIAMFEKAKIEGHEHPRLLFCAHGLPESIIKGGDPYQAQCEQTAQAIVESLAIDNLDWAICYQSRVGSKKWITPFIDDEFCRASKDQKPVIVFPHTFTQEHIETLVELDIEYRELAKKFGIPAFYRVKTVSTHPDFIKGLASLIRAC